MKLKLQLQHDETDCAAACLRMILSYFGKNESLRRLRLKAGTDTSGTSGYGISLCAKENGLSCKGFSTRDKNIIKTIPCPAIFHTIQNNLEHYVVVKKVKKDQVTIFDPANGIEKLSLQDFFTHWTGIFFLCKPENDKLICENDKTSLFTDFFLSNKKIFSKIIFSSLLITVFSIFMAFYFRFLVDDVLYSQISSTLNLVSVCYLLLLVFQMILSFCRNQLSIVLGAKIDLALTSEFFNHLVKLPLNFFSARKTGEILSRLRDTENLRQLISSTTVSVFMDSIMILIGGFFLVKTGSTLVLYAVIPVILSSLVVLFFSKLFKKLIKARAISLGNRNASFYETINGISTIKALSTEESAIRRNEILSVDCLQHSLHLENLGNLNRCIQNFLSGLGTLLIYWIGSYKIFNGELSLGQLISFATLSSFFLSPLSRLLTMQPAIQEAMVSLERLKDIFAEKCEEETSSFDSEITEFKKQIQFNNISFSYGTRGKALDNISLEINKGERIGIVGYSGSGKSTLIKLLLKFYKLDEGEILIDGKNINQLNTKDVRNLFGYVPQDSLLFSGTIAENIAWGMKFFTPKMIKDCGIKAEADSFIKNLSAGYSTKIGENGANLSGGEKQRICIARALMRSPQILLLDEATSSLDNLKEAAIMKTIKKLNKTTIIVAHRLNCIKDCDRIYVFDKGKIVEQGNHNQLLNNKGKYSELWEAQNGQ